MKLTLKQGEQLVKLAREAISASLEDKKISTDKLPKDKLGIFVTLDTYPDNFLRGCIGFPYPTLTIGEAIPQAAKSAAFKDSRFQPLKKEELGNITVEVTILTEPTPIKVDDPKEYPNKIKLGEDGLIIKKAGASGLLLPQVATDNNWKADEFLDETCIKAGLSQDCWLGENIEILKFQGQIFREEKPNGKVIEKKQ